MDPAPRPPEGTIAMLFTDTEGSALVGGKIAAEGGWVSRTGGPWKGRFSGRPLPRRVGGVGPLARLSPEPAELTAAGWREVVLEAERAGELLAAADLAERGLAEHWGDLWLAHRAVLALARAGSTEEASLRFDAYGLAGVASEDVAGLRARIAKDTALAATGARRRREAARSAALYAAVFARTGGYYPAINAATLSLVAGDAAGARSRAARVLELLGDDGYYAAATEAEAELLLGRVERARAALERAATLHGGDHGAVATTRRQLRLVCDLTGTDRAVLAGLAGPAVVHYCGHRISAGGRFPAAAEDGVARAIDAELERRPAVYAYGSLASGADILWAEALLARGAELHVVLPFAQDEFERTSVAPAGDGWVERFRRCVGRATAVRFATEDAFLGEDVLYRYGTELAMGLALLRARFLDSDIRQLAVWDGGPAHGDAGTAIDVAAWRRGGREAAIVPVAGVAAEPGPAPLADPRGSRVVRAMLFADVKAFSKLTDEQQLHFAEAVLGAFAGVMDRYREVLYRNSWGDGVHVTLRGVEAAAACALELQATMGAIDFAAAGLPADLSLRLGAHYGPVFEVYDPIRGATAFTGSHVTRTARVEPVTPPRAVYVTEPFAAALVLAGRDDLACDYVGHMPAAKDYGRLRMYRLRRRS